jgi:hypothetical protein
MELKTLRFLWWMCYYRKKYSYIELFTLIAFQILLFFAFLNRLAYVDAMYTRWRAMRFILPDDTPSPQRYLKTYNAPDVLKEWRKQHKKIITIDLTGDLQEDKKRLEFIRNEAQRLKYTYDTTSILKVHFTDENTYGQFVELLNIMIKDRHKRYMLFQDNFYVAGETYSEN